jgi:hypothetical protein
MRSLPQSAMSLWAHNYAKSGAKSPSINIFANERRFEFKANNSVNHQAPRIRRSNANGNVGGILGHTMLHSRTRRRLAGPAIVAQSIHSLANRSLNARELFSHWNA